MLDCCITSRNRGWGGRFRKNKLETAEQIQNGNTSEMLHPALKSLLQKIYSVNENRVSKVVDENGEPLVVYHGSNHWFNIFNEEKLYHLPKTGEGILVKDKGILNIFLDIT